MSFPLFPRRTSTSSRIITTGHASFSICFLMDTIICSMENPLPGNMGS